MAKSLKIDAEFWHILGLPVRKTHIHPGRVVNPRPYGCVDLPVGGTYHIEFGQPNPFVVFLPVYVRGGAYLTLGDADRAAGEFQKFIDHPGLVTNFSWGALARLGLARAYALEAQSAQGAEADRAGAKAKAAYQHFLTLRKDADPDIPILMQAKVECAKLRQN